MPGRLEVEQRERTAAIVVAAGVPPAVEPGFQPGGKNLTPTQAARKLCKSSNTRAPFRAAGRTPSTAGKDARRYNAFAAMSRRKCAPSKLILETAA